MLAVQLAVAATDGAALAIARRLLLDRRAAAPAAKVCPVPWLSVLGPSCASRVLCRHCSLSQGLVLRLDYSGCLHAGHNGTDLELLLWTIAARKVTLSCNEHRALDGA